MATGKCSSSTLMLKQMHSLAVKASMLPPMESTWRAIFFGAAVLRALEHHVFDEVRDAVLLQVFVPGTGLDPDPDRDRANMLHLLGDQGQPVGQHLAAYVSDFLDHVGIVAQRGRVRRICS